MAGTRGSSDWLSAVTALLVVWLAFSPPTALSAWDGGAHVDAGQAVAHHAADRSIGREHHRSAQVRVVMPLVGLSGLPNFLPTTAIDPTLGTDRLSDLMTNGTLPPMFDPPLRIQSGPLRWQSVTLPVSSLPPRTETYA